MDNFISPFATFKYGREDCATAPYTDETFEFPSTHLTHEEVFTYFQEVFGFDKNQVKYNQNIHPVNPNLSYLAPLPVSFWVLL